MIAWIAANRLLTVMIAIYMLMTLRAVYGHVRISIASRRRLRKQHDPATCAACRTDVFSRNR